MVFILIILHAGCDRVKQQAFFGPSLAIFTKQAGSGATRRWRPPDRPGPACLVNYAKLQAKFDVSFDRQ
jgi:hypothetical protein